MLEPGRVPPSAREGHGAVLSKRLQAVPCLAWLAFFVGCSGDAPVGPAPAADAGVRSDGESSAAGEAGLGGAAGCAPVGPEVPGCFPGDVAPIIRSKCQRCHDTAPALEDCLAAGSCLRAPFPLATWQDTQVLSGGKPVYERMGSAITSGFMPLRSNSVVPPVEPLSAAEEMTLLEWIGECGPPSATGCPPP